MSSKKSTETTDYVHCSLKIDINDPDPRIRAAAKALRDGFNISSDQGVFQIKGKNLALYCITKVVNQAMSSLQSSSDINNSDPKTEEVETPKRKRRSLHDINAESISL